MNRYKVRFEQNRGHCLVLEGEPPFTRNDCDDFRLRMLRECEVPGLLRLETEEIDGCLAFRYSLSGTRMLSQAVRSEKWTMRDFLAALCRLAEVMEDCRLYVLDERQIALSDDLIFTGDGWQDLRFVYMPFLPAADAPENGLKELIVRWMMRVADLDGAVMQRILAAAVSPDFKPGMLRRLARQVLAGSPDKHDGFSGSAQEERPGESSGNDRGTERPNRHSVAAVMEASGSRSWRWFPPSHPEPQALSGLLGADAADYGVNEARKEEPAPPDSGRQRVWLICVAAALTAIIWKWGYSNRGGQENLFLPSALTAVVWGGLYGVWRRLTGRTAAAETSERTRRTEERLEEGVAEPWEPEPSFRIEEPASALERTGYTGWEADRTEQLSGNREHHGAGPASCYLEWETGSSVRRIDLDRPSFVIGRSKEASRHVDDTFGISRAHAELLRTEDGWTARDLGSRNGSRLNDIPMVPYEIYPLQTDDCLELAGSRYRFKTASRVWQ